MDSKNVCPTSYWNLMIEVPLEIELFKVELDQATILTSKKYFSEFQINLH